MIHSMTAYSQSKTQGNWGTAIWEIRSINQRFLETCFRLPEQFRNLEPVIRDRIRSYLTRGKIDCILHLEQGDSLNMLSFNKRLAKQLISAARWIKFQSNEGEINPVDILNWPGVMVAQEKDLNMITSEVIVAFENTLQDLIKVRETEGQVIRALIEQRLKKIDIEVKKVRSHMPEILKWQRDRLISKLENFTACLENNRLEQELILMAQRIDIHEELDRISAHVKEIYNLLNKREIAVGRRIDFIIQELNRESNTLASKSINSNITNSAIELKVLIEQMREQIQNIE